MKYSRIAILTGLLASTTLTYGQSIHSGKRQEWFANLPEYGQTYFAEGYRAGVSGTVGLLTEWLDVYGRVPEKGLEFIRVLSQLEDYVYDACDAEYFRMMIMYPPPGPWRKSVLMETYDALVEQLKEAPVGKLVR